jgi:WD40 repeat protein
MIWKAGNNTPIHVFRDHQSPVTAAALTVDMRRCFSADKGGKMIVRNLLTNNQENVFQGHIGDITDLELSTDARFLFSSAKDGIIKVWNLAESGSAFSIEGHPAAVTTMRLEISGRRLVTGCADGVVRAWELFWNHRFPGWQPISAEAISALRSLASLYSEDGVEKPNIDEATANRIILEMDYCGFGTIPSKALKQALDDLLADWKS